MAETTFVRRSPFLVVHWKDGLPVVENYATSRIRSTDPLEFEVLDVAREWSEIEELVARLEGRDAARARRAVRHLLEDTMLEEMDDPPEQHARALRRWDNWNPAAGIFHQATRNVRYLKPVTSFPPADSIRLYPSHLKDYPDLDRLDLPPFPRGGELPEVLLERRTWRRFGQGPVSLDDLATLLGLTWGVQIWVGGGRSPRVPFKTSPSGGAKHSVEAYVMALAVEDIPAAIYHYCPDAHDLAVIREGTPKGLLRSFLPGQTWFHEPAAVVFMTSVFQRVQYKYQHPRAYRVILLEAGHLAQTFCLLATWLGLAPFCTAALSDSAIEAHLDIDGIDEAVLYAVGVGTRPEEKLGPLEAGRILRP